VGGNDSNLKGHTEKGVALSASPMLNPGEVKKGGVAKSALKESGEKRQKGLREGRGHPKKVTEGEK